MTNIKRPIHFDPTDAPPAPPANATEAFAGLTAALEAEKSATPPPANPPAKTAEEIATEKATPPAKAAEEIAAEAKANEGKTSEEIAAASKLAEESNDLPLPELNEEAIEANWIDFGKETGLEIKVDDYNEAVTAIKAKNAAEYERGKADAVKLDVSTLPPDIRDIVLAAQGGAKLEDILNPVAQFNAAIALPDEDVVRGVLQNQYKMKAGADGKLTEADTKILDDEIEVLTENGTLKTDARKYRALLETARDNKVNEVVSKGKASWEDEQKRIGEITEKENKSVLTALEGRKEFMKAKITPQHVSALMKKWESGHYKQQFNDPEKVADFILYSEYGKAREQKLYEDLKKQVKVDEFKNLSNTQSLGAGGKGPENAGIPQSLGEQFGELLQQGVRR